MSVSTRRILFFLFFVSGFCGLLYQVIWTRIAFAAFGIVLPVLSVILSVFMLGLALGSWAGGSWIGPLTKKTRRSAAYFYAAAEFTIGLGAFIVPRFFGFGVRLLLSSGQTDSLQYLLLSALILAISILPWCVAMGMTFPFMMAYVREVDQRSEKSFSYLYLANVLGAMVGTFLTAIVLVELLGFAHTLLVAATGNFLIAALSIWLGSRQPVGDRAAEPSAAEPAEMNAVAAPDAGAMFEASPAWLMKATLFSTGFGSMAMEVIWTRSFTPVLGTQVYSYAMVVCAYLGATFLGSLVYRQELAANAKPERSLPQILALLAVTAFVPVMANDSRIDFPDGINSPPAGAAAVVLLICIVPFCIILGYLTPRLIDESSRGQPRGAGQAYAINVLGCILGPLFASYLLLPYVSERVALMVLGIPFVGFFLLTLRSLTARWRLVTGLATIGVVVWSLFFTVDFQTGIFKSWKTAQVRRDYAASVISFGTNRDNKHVLVNGIGMTILTPMTKFMVHLPLSFLKEPPTSALIICFGMGTSFRSALTWDIDVTAVELVPSVPKAFGYYHSDAAQVLQNPKGHIVIDDGRRYMARTDEKYDIIVIDPPPPVSAAGSSLLYSTEFYALAKQRLKPHGILQAWIPGEVDTPTVEAVFRSAQQSFPYARCFDSVAKYGTHILLSLEPIESRTADELVARMPEKAKKDLVEWAPGWSTQKYVDLVLRQEHPIASYESPNPEIRITDDRPFNEYTWVRAAGLSWR